MELAKTRQPPIPGELKFGDEVLHMELNLELVTAKFLDDLADTGATVQESIDRIKSDLVARVRAAPKGRKKAVAQAAKQAANQKQGPSLIRAQAIELKFMARALGGDPGNRDATRRVIAGWDMVHQGEPVEPTYEFFVGQPQGFLLRLFEYVLFEAPLKKTTSNGSAATS